MKKSDNFDFEESMSFSEAKVKKLGDLSWELSRPDATWTFEAKDAHQVLLFVHYINKLL